MIDSTNKGSDYPKSKSGSSNREKHTQNSSVSSPAKSADSDGNVYGGKIHQREHYTRTLWISGSQLFPPQGD